MTEVSSNEKPSRRRMVAPPRFDTTDDYLACLIFGSVLDAAEFGSRFQEANADA